MSGKQPNILFIVTDQQSWNMMSCVGNQWLETPAMDRIAAEGIRLNRTYCANPVCSPSRFSMFTGRMPSEINVRHNSSKDALPLPESEYSNGLGHLLRSAGYDCRYGGKEHFSGAFRAEDIGFDYFCKDECMELAEASADFIKQEHDKPWCLVSSLINPHDICYHAIRAFASMEFDQRLIERGQRECAALDKALEKPAGVSDEDFFETYCPPLPDNHQPQQDEPSAVHDQLQQRDFKLGARNQWTDEDWRMHRWAYHRLTETVDSEVQVILDALEQSGEQDNTLVIFTSDHGDHDSSHKLEHKTLFYEEAARVPLLMRLPGSIPAASVDDQHLVNNGLDILPTICDYAGAPVPEHCQGQSLRAQIESGGSKAVRDGVYAENEVSYMWCTRDYKYVRYDHGDNAEQLYDLNKDPGETRNAAADFPEITAACSKRLDEEMAKHAAQSLVPSGV